MKSTLYHQVGGEALPEMAALREENRDLVGWLTLSTCLNEDRLVVVARRQREGEETAGLRRVVRLCAPR